MEQSEVSEHHLWMCGAVFRPDAAFCGMRLPRARQATSRRHAATRAGVSAPLLDSFLYLGYYT